MKPERLVIIIIVLALLLRLSFFLFGLNYVSAMFYEDDTYYSLKIAQNIAAGQGFTFDSIHMTNGFQPLIVYIMVPFFMFIQNLVVNAFIVGILCAIFNSLTVLFVYKIAKRYTSDGTAIFAACIFAFAPHIIWSGINGLETGLAVFMLSVLLYYYLAYVQGKDITAKQAAVFAFLIALTFLARMDLIIFILALGIDYLARSKLKLKKEIFYAAGLSIAFVALLWLLPSYIGTGKVFPESGSAVRYMSIYTAESHFPGQLVMPDDSSIPQKFYLLNILAGVRALASMPALNPPVWLGNFVLPYLFGATLGMAVAGVLIIAAFAYILVKIKNSKKSTAAFRDTQFLFYFSLAFFAFYIFYMFGQWFYIRYFYPIYFVSVLYLAFAFEAIASNKRLSQAILVIFLVSFAIYIPLRFVAFPYGAKTMDKAIYARDNIPAGAVVGSPQTGAIAYFSGKVAINLDGVVNYDVVSYMRERRMLDYIREQHITYIIDEDYILWDLVFRRSQNVSGVELVHRECRATGCFEVYKVS